MLRLALLPFLLASTLAVKGQGYKFNNAAIERMRRKRAATLAKKLPCRYT